MSADIKLKKPFENPRLMFIVAVIVSCAFVPAFLYGLITPWVVVFSVFSALLFNACLSDIIASCKVVEKQDQRSFRVIGQYLLLVLKLSIVASIAPITFAYIASDQSIQQNDLDALFLNFSPILMSVNGSYLESYLSLKVLVIGTLPVLLLLFLIFFISFRKLNELASLAILLPENYSQEFRGHRGYTIYKGFMALSVFVTFVAPLIYFNAIGDQIQKDFITFSEATIFIFAAYSLVLIWMGLLSAAKIVWMKY